jgi:hypothetical protein
MAGKLVDTTLLIDLSRGSEQAADYVDQERAAGTTLFISVVSAMELIVGCRNKVEVAKAEKLFSDFSMIQLSPAISQKAYELVLTYSKRHGLLIPDALIAATALEGSFELVSDNVRDFKMIQGLDVTRPF